MGFPAKELEQTQYSVNVMKGGATRDVQGSEILEKHMIPLDVQQV